VRLAYTSAMRVLVISIALVITACGQTGSLYLPDESVETPVEIREPADVEKDEKKKPEQPPGS
jgi:predicted small lipoprotein YifL